MVEKLGRNAVTFVGAIYSFNGIIWIVRIMRLALPIDSISFLDSGAGTAVFLILFALGEIAIAVGKVFMVKEEMGGPSGGPPISQLLFGR